MMTFKNVEFVGGADSTIMGGGFCNQDYFINFSNDYALWLNLDCYDLAISSAAEQIDNFVASYGETISEEEINKAIEALKECYEINKGTLSRDGYISRIAELICNDTIKADSWFEKKDDTMEIYRVDFTIKENGWKESTWAFVNIKEATNLITFPQDWQGNYPISMFLNDGRIEFPEDFNTRTYYMSEGKVHEY